MKQKKYIKYYNGFRISGTKRVVDSVIDYLKGKYHNDNKEMSGVQ